MNTPANDRNTIREMENGLAAMEDALKNHSLHADTDFLLGVDDGESAYDLLGTAIEDVKAALAYAQSGVLCPECMTISRVGSKRCCNCGLVFG